MMRARFSQIDRSVLLGASVLVASLALLGAAVVSIFAALNNDGATKIGYTAPSIDGQAQVIVMAMGLAGVEASHSDHNPAVREKYRKLAAELALIPTAGSDFHGASKPLVALGRIYQGTGGDDALIAAIAASASRRSGSAPPPAARTPAAG